MKFILNRTYLINRMIPLGMMAAMIFATTSCKDEVDLPAPIIKLDTEAILAPSLLSSFNVAVESNCDWTASAEGEDTGWLTITEGKNVGNGDLKLTLRPNETSAQREITITVRNEFNTAMARLSVTQNPSSGDGLVSVSELRSLSGTSHLTLGEDALMRGVVVSNMQHGNFPDRLIAVEGKAEENNGIAVRTTDEYLVSAGQEIEIKLKDAQLSTDPTTGLLVLTPASDAAISRTEATSIIPTPLDVSIPELLTGKYESMYVKVSGQISSSDINKEYLYEAGSFVDEDNNAIALTVFPDCSFSESVIPTGSGHICGVAGSYGGATCIYPGNVSDFSLTGSRFDGGFSLPYIISLMTNTATNFDGRYIEVDRTSENINEYFARTLDGSGATIKWNLSEKGQYYRFWTDNSGHHNFQLGSWVDNRDNYLLFSYPAGVEFTDGFRLQFGWSGQKNAPRNWEVLYSTDNENWSTGKTSTIFSLPKDMVGTAGKGYSDFTVDVHIDKPIAREDPLYIKIRRADSNEAVNTGASISSTDGRAIFHSCMLLDKLPVHTTTATPSGAIYFEPFDGLTEGADYRLGDKLSAMLNYAGSDITEWSDDIRKSLTGTNVRQRPGYAQIGYVNTVDVAHGSYKNETGELITPKLNAAGSYRLSFKAMAYKNKAVFASAVKDRKGDITQGIIEIIGGGTINGQTSVSFGAMDYDSFKTFTYSIENVTPETQIRFSSSPASSEYSRWFIDNICVK